jgi:hypothetical protein
VGSEPAFGAVVVGMQPILQIRAALQPGLVPGSARVPARVFKGSWWTA